MASAVRTVAGVAQANVEPAPGRLVLLAGDQDTGSAIVGCDSASPQVRTDRAARVRHSSRAPGPLRTNLASAQQYLPVPCTSRPGRAAAVARCRCGSLAHDGVGIVDPPDASRAPASSGLDRATGVFAFGESHCGVQASNLNVVRQRRHQRGQDEPHDRDDSRGGKRGCSDSALRSTHRGSRPTFYG